FNQMLDYKAENAGKTHITVESPNTTIECSQCGAMVPKDLGTRIHNCPECGAVLGRDYNASLVILQRGLEKVGRGPPELTPVDILASTSEHLGCKPEWKKQDASPFRDW
ncbi:MAG: zinc ribbon domain-containing protein, partial [Candidatus Thermoplasmatota archaeon]